MNSESGAMSNPAAGHVGRAIAALNEKGSEGPDPAVARRIIQAMAQSPVLQAGNEPCACNCRHTSGAITLAELEGVWRLPISACR